MIQIIAGEKGKGKTKFLLEKVNNAVKDASGSIVYLDKSSKHMFELNNKVRLINVSDFPISNCDEFLGFLCGVVSQDHDLETMYLDSFLTIAAMKDDEICEGAAAPVCAPGQPFRLLQCSGWLIFRKQSAGLLPEKHSTSRFCP